MPQRTACPLRFLLVGSAALVAVQTFADSVALAVARSAKSLLGADLEIRSTHPLSPESAGVVAASRARALP